MRLVTVCTHPEGYYTALVASAKRHGYQLDVLGYGLKWQGFTWKFHLLTEYFKQQPDDEVVIFCDAYDVIVRRDAKTAEACFREMKVPVVFSIDRSFTHAVWWHPGRYAFHKKFPFARDYNLCSGLYMGYAKALRELLALTRTMPNDYNDDQRQLALLTQRRPELFHLDTTGTIFHNLTAYPAHNEQALIDRACLVHAPGNLSLDAIIEADQLPVGQPIDLAIYTWRLLPTTLRLFRYELLGCLVIVLLLIYSLFYA